MRILIYILAGTIIGSFIYFYIIDNLLNKNNYSQIVFSNESGDKDDDDEDVNRLIMHNNKLSIKFNWKFSACVDTGLDFINHYDTVRLHE